MRDLKEIIKIAVGALEDKKGEDIKTAVGFFWIIMTLLFIFLIMTADITMILKEYGVMDRLLNKSD